MHSSPNPNPDAHPSPSPNPNPTPHPSEALDALAAVRAYHLRIASRYLRRTGTGTGGSDFRPMLGEAVQSTREASTQAPCDTAV